MTIYVVTHEGENYGTFETPSMEAALMAALLTINPDRRHRATLVSTLPEFGYGVSWVDGGGGLNTKLLWHVSGEHEYGVFMLTETDVEEDAD